MNQVTFALVCGLFLILFVLASGSSVWAACPTIGTVPIDCVPIGSPGGNTNAGNDTAMVPPGSAPDGSTIAMFRPPLNGLPTGSFRTYGDGLRAVIITGPNGNSITTLNSPITICFTLTAVLVNQAEGPGNIVIEWWNTAKGLWQALPTRPGSTPFQFCASTSQL